jgi:uncharacterized membrane protein YphA (DoxX/SURF4 family)
MFDTSSFRIRYKAPVEKPLLIAAGPLVILAVLAAALWSRYAAPISIGPWISPDLLGLLLPIAALAALAIVIERMFGADEGYPWRRSIAATGAGVVGGTLLVGAWGKLLDPIAFAQNLRLEGITSWLGSGWYPATVPALLVIAIEVLLGSLLVLGVRYRSTLVATGLLVAFFLFLTGRAWWRDAHGIVTGDAASCGCFGNLLDRTPREAFFQDAALLVPGLLLALLGVLQRHMLGRRVATAWLVTAAAVTLGWFAPGLPVDDLATRLAPGRAASSICAGRGEERLCLPTLIPELAHGRHLVVLLDLEAKEMDAEVESLNHYWLANESPRLWVLSAATAEQSRAFFWKYGPAFEVREVPPSMLRPLYRSLPRSFLVWDGKVTETWSGLAPMVVASAGNKPPARALTDRKASGEAR